MRLRTSMTVSAMICSGTVIIRRWNEPVRKSAWEFRSLHNSNTWQLVWFIWMCMTKGMFQTDFTTLGNLGCTCTALKFTLKMSTLSTWKDALSTIFWWPTLVLMKFTSVSLVAISTSSRASTGQATSEMLMGSASSQKRQKLQMKPKGRRNRLLPTGKPPQRKAPLVRLPELPKEI